MTLVSACLAGVNCNYEGRNSENSRIVQMVKEGRAVMVCPEQLGGLTTPRTPAEIKNGRVFTNDGEDVTDAFFRGAGEVLAVCKKFNCDKAILKSNSPSCGCCKIYDGNFNNSLVDGDGITAALLKEHGIKVTAL